MAGTYVRVQFSLIILFFKEKVFYKLKTKGNFWTLKLMIKETEIGTFVWHFVALENLISKLMNFYIWGLMLDSFIFVIPARYDHHGISKKQFNP